MESIFYIYNNKVSVCCNRAVTYYMMGLERFYKCLNCNKICKIKNREMRKTIVGQTSSRANIDFSKHELKIVKSESFQTYHLKKPDTIHQNIKFIFIDELMIVKGDYGNWLFSVQFFPKPDELVSEGYWIEKLHMSSTQNGYVLDNESCEEELNNIINGSLKDHGYDQDVYDGIRDFCKEMLSYVNCDEEEYKRELLDRMPQGMDYEFLSGLMIKKPHHWLQAVFDGWEEICDRLKDEEEAKGTD